MKPSTANYALVTTCHFNTRRTEAFEQDEYLTLRICSAVGAHRYCCGNKPVKNSLLTAAYKTYASDLRETSLPESRAVDRAENYSLLSCMFCVTWAVAQTLVWERAVLQATVRDVVVLSVFVAGKLLVGKRLVGPRLNISAHYPTPACLEVVAVLQCRVASGPVLHQFYFSMAAPGTPVADLAGCRGGSHDSCVAGFELMWVSMAGPTRWRLELGATGELPIACGDVVCALHGSPDAGWQGERTLWGAPRLVVRDELGGELVLEGRNCASGCVYLVPGDDRGPTADWVAEWLPERPGPYEVHVLYPGVGENQEVLPDAIQSIPGCLGVLDSVVGLTYVEFWTCGDNLQRHGRYPLSDDWRSETAWLLSAGCTLLRRNSDIGVSLQMPESRFRQVSVATCDEQSDRPHLVVQLTVLSRLAGPIECWPETLAPQAALGYNMIHFTPIQKPGESGSCYALDDQGDVDSTLMESPPADTEGRFQVVQNAVERLEELGLLSAVDIVLNHSAGSAPWLLEHPESAYSVHTCPHLTAAAELDLKLAWFSNELKNGNFGGPQIQNHGDVERVLDGIRQHVLGALKLREYFRVDEAACVEAWSAAEAVNDRKPHQECYDALRNSLLPTLGHKRSGAVIPGDVSRACCGDLGSLKGYIGRLQKDLGDHFGALEGDIVNSLRGAITYERLELRKGPVGDGNMALVEPYFRRIQLTPGAAQRLGYESDIMAHNGWVMDWPATEDFAMPSWRMVYLRRHLCVWTDTVKLFYGRSREDAPFLWDFMTDYAVGMAKIFHAVRLDNAHSTPLHVSRHVLSRVREANPHCWVFAELFTGNFETDLLYQRTLGINALIREAMQCDSPHDLGHKLESPLWNGHPVGALSPVPTLDRAPPTAQQKHLSKCPSRSLLAAPAREALPLLPRHCPALLFDCTHDNQTPAQKRHPRDALPNAAIVAASCASAGSVRGYDDLFPSNPSVVSERRLYAKAPHAELVNVSGLDLAAESSRAEEAPESEKEFEIIWHEPASKVVARGAWDGWREDLTFQKTASGHWSAKLKVEVHRLPLQYKFIVDDTWTINRKLPLAQDEHGNQNNVLSVPGAASTPSSPNSISGPDVLVNNLPGILLVKQVLNRLHTRLGCEGYTEIGVHFLADDALAIERRSPDNGHSVWFVVRSAFWRDRMGDGLSGGTEELEVDGIIAHLHVAATLFVGDQHENGYRPDGKLVTGMECFLHVYSSVHEVANVWTQGGNSRLRLHRFPPGSILVFSTDVSKTQARQKAVMDLLAAEQISRPLQGLSLHQVNYLLYSCEAEERDRSNGARGAYEIPGFGPFAYCGLMGVCAALDEARRQYTEAELLTSPVLANVRQGDWLMACLTQRLVHMPGLEMVKEWLEKAAGVLANCPRKLAPFYFDLMVPGLCAAASKLLLDLSSDFVSEFNGASDLIRDVALATTQFWGATKSAPLHWDLAQRDGWHKLPSLCAGLPHFAAGFMRNWGRDTFIALKGCLLVTGHFQEARDTLLVYASVIRHGLCPNLLDAANRPRYNARDATWFFMQAIQDYVAESPEGESFLSTPVSLKWPVKDWDPDLAHVEVKTIADVIHLIFSAHAKGISFREWGAGRGPDAGKGIDDDMSEWGFDVNVRLDEKTGLIFGGSEHNCGTWMDKMGSSAKAGNKGKPATPRDGAAVEIIGLLKSALRWVSGLSREVFPYEQVRTASGQQLTYKDWDGRLAENFERLFWIDPDEKTGASVAGIYRDTLGATRKWQDAQLRPNFCIAMTVAPELFLPDHANTALQVAASRLVGPLGMRTLDPSDKEYRGDYHNDNDSNDQSIAHGWNYHQGPEWVWPLGFFLEAWHHFGSLETSSPAPARFAMQWLLPHREMLRKAPWRSLPELTNSNGEHCHHSCPAQAWSLATLLSALRTMTLQA
ncbi:AGL [Symbiodinium natans]|uniref:AGL protein n=1 Tax=Symbiodinium natans TaxID=878477 RepID=A0A812PRN2_9DINO|nr:AGL [Symbiodinium natans]